MLCQRLEDPAHVSMMSSSELLIILFLLLVPKKRHRNTPLKIRVRLQVSLRKVLKALDVIGPVPLTFKKGPASFVIPDRIK